MREYEFTVVLDLAVAESGDEDAGVEILRSHVEARGGRVLSADHWGRRRMAYPIRGAIDGDYIVTRIELPTDAVQLLNDALRIDERVYRHLLVRADELPPPPPPREPRRRPETDVRETPAAAPPAPSPATPAAPSVETPPEPPAEPAASPTDPAPAPVEAAESTSATGGDEVSPPPATVDGEQAPGD